MSVRTDDLETVAERRARRAARDEINALIDRARDPAAVRAPPPDAVELALNDACALLLRLGRDQLRLERLIGAERRFRRGAGPSEISRLTERQRELGEEISEMRTIVAELKSICSSS